MRKHWNSLSILVLLYRHRTSSIGSRGVHFGKTKEMEAQTTYICSTQFNTEFSAQGNNASLFVGRLGGYGYGDID